ncbi:MAG: DUF2127 domain-containing protein [Lysobacter sp.]|nr:MAG: DUF2127 domain-containing protein [Lysobacter sp.]
MDHQRREHALHEVFLVSVWIKGLVGLLQMLGGLLLLVVSQQWLTSLVLSVTAPELVEDPGDRIALFLRQSAAQWGGGTQLFAAVYLLLHGLIKVALVAGLLRRQLWAYPASLAVLGGFIVYQVYRYSHTHSIWLVLLTVLDVVVVALVAHEYRIRRRAGFPGASHPLPTTDAKPER